TSSAVPIGDIPNDPEYYDTDQIGRARQSEAQSFECGETVLHSVGACRLSGERRCGLGNWGLVGLKWLRSVALALIVHGRRSTRSGPPVGATSRFLRSSWLR